MDSADFFWPDVAEVPPTGALTFGVFGIEVAEAVIVLFELEVGNRPPELEARDELLVPTFSLGGVAEAGLFGSVVGGTNGNIPAILPSCFDPELSETA